MRVNFATTNNNKTHNKKQNVSFRDMYINTTKTALRQIAKKECDNYKSASKGINYLWASLKKRQKIEKGNNIKIVIAPNKHGSITAIFTPEDFETYRNNEIDKESFLEKITGSAFSHYGVTTFFEKMNTKLRELKNKGISKT